MALGWLVTIAVLAAGLGWLYLLRNLGALAQGPLLADALPLQQLSSHANQPLLRVAVAWMPAGAVAGLALAWIGGLRLLTRTVGLALLSALLLLASAAASAAVAQNERFGEHIGPTLGHSGIWAAVACIAIGSLLVAPAAPRARRGAAAAASAA